MLKIDETQLIEFFSVLPEPQPPGEREFFAAPFFRKVVGGLVLDFSVSAHFADMTLSLSHEGVADPLLAMTLPDVAAISTDRYGGRQWLRIVGLRQTVEIAVEPSVSIKLSPSRAAL